MELNFQKTRNQRLSQDFDSYMARRIEEEIVISQTITTLLEESLGMWGKPEDITFIDDRNYVVKIKGRENSLELATYQGGTGDLLMIEGENSYFTFDEIEEVLF